MRVLRAARIGIGLLPILGTWSVPSHAEPASQGTDYEICRAPLARDVLTREYSGLTHRTFKEEVKEVACNSKYREQLRSREGAIKVVIPQYRLPLEAAGKSASEDRVWEDNCRSLFASVNENDFNAVGERLVDNSIAVAAFSSCIQNVNGGFRLSAGGGPPAVGSSFAVKVEWLPHVIAGPSALKITGVNPGTTVCHAVTPILQVNGAQQFQCTRKSSDAILITMNTDPQYTGSIYFPPLVPEKKEAPPTPASCSITLDHDEVVAEGSRTVLKCSQSLPRGKYRLYVKGTIEVEDPQSNGCGECSTWESAIDVKVGSALTPEDAVGTIASPGNTWATVSHGLAGVFATKFAHEGVPTIELFVRTSKYTHQRYCSRAPQCGTGIESNRAPKHTRFKKGSRIEIF